MKILKNVLEFIACPFLTVAVLIDESRRLNEDGSWDKYWERKNRRLLKKEARKARRMRERGRD